MVKFVNLQNRYTELLGKQPTTFQSIFESVNDCDFFRENEQNLVVIIRVSFIDEILTACLRGVCVRPAPRRNKIPEKAPAGEQECRQGRQVPPSTDVKLSLADVPTTALTHW